MSADHRRRQARAARARIEEIRDALEWEWKRARREFSTC
jgi:cell division protein FtsL